MSRSILVPLSVLYTRLSGLSFRVLGHAIAITHGVEGAELAQKGYAAHIADKVGSPVTSVRRCLRELRALGFHPFTDHFPPGSLRGEHGRSFARLPLWLMNKARSGATFRVLTLLFASAEKTGATRWSLDGITERLGLSRRSVARARAELSDDGIISVSDEGTSVPAANMRKCPREHAENGTRGTAPSGSNKTPLPPRGGEAVGVEVSPLAKHCTEELAGAFGEKDPRRRRRLEKAVDARVDGEASARRLLEVARHYLAHATFKVDALTFIKSTLDKWRIPARPRRSVKTQRARVSTLHAGRNNVTLEWMRRASALSEEERRANKELDEKIRRQGDDALAAFSHIIPGVAL